jgi:hypothetical protein
MQVGHAILLQVDNFNGTKQCIMTDQRLVAVLQMFVLGHDYFWETQQYNDANVCQTDKKQNKYK